MDNKKIKKDEQEEELKEELEDEGIEEETEEKEEGEENETSDLKERVEDLENQLKRSVADYRNLEKRLDDEKREFVKFANRDLLLRLIPAFDTLFLAAKYVTDEGIKITIKNLQDSLAEVGVQRVETEGQEFDPSVMEVVTTGDGEENMVLEELRPGFTLNGKLVRPAQVKVGKKE